MAAQKKNAKLPSDSRTPGNSTPGADRLDQQAESMEKQPGVERAERLDSSKSIARGGKEKGFVPGASSQSANPGRSSSMRVQDVMTRQTECIHSEASIQQAAEKMKKLDVGSIPIMDNNQLVGMITDRDITIRSVAEGSNPQMSRVRDVMTHEVIYCFEDQDVAEALQLMRSQQIRRLPVLDRQKHLVGIVSLGDLAVEAPDEELVGHALEGISLPSGQPLNS